MIILLLVLVLFVSSISKFIPFDCNSEGQFSTPGGDISYRSYPSGNLPINYPELNEYERSEYLRKFVENKY